MHSAADCLTSCIDAHMLSHVPLFANTWTVAHQDPLPMGFSRQEYWRGQLFQIQLCCGFFVPLDHLWIYIYTHTHTRIHTNASFQHLGHILNLKIHYVTLSKTRKMSLLIDDNSDNSVKSVLNRYPKQDYQNSQVYYCCCCCVTRQSCPTLCDPTDGSPPGSPVSGILQARTLEWVAFSFSNARK